MKDHTQEYTQQLKLRLPPDLKKKVEEAAREHKRSLNSELVWIISQYFENLTNAKDEKSLSPISLNDFLSQWGKAAQEFSKIGDFFKNNPDIVQSIKAIGSLTEKEAAAFKKKIREEEKNKKD